MASAAAGFVVGTAVGSLGGALPSPVTAAIATVLYMAIALGALTRATPWPQFNRETEQRLLHAGPVGWSLWNGALLGLGFTSRIGFWSWYLLPIGALLVDEPFIGGLVWALYGGARMSVAFAAAYVMRRQTAGMVSVSTNLLTQRAQARSITRAVSVALSLTAVLIVGI